jgi:hypothetical protein
MKIEGLSVEVLWHDEDVLQLMVRVGNDEFSGAGKVYVAHGELREVAAAMAGFPSGRGDERHFTLGSFDPAAPGGGVSIHLKCETSAGHSFADVRVESDTTEGPMASAAFRFPFEAGAVDNFVVDLRHLDDQRAGAARLDARGNGADAHELE